MAESSTIVVPESGNNANSMLPFAMMNGGMNNWMNNPFAYLMFMPFMASFANGGWGNGRGGYGYGNGIGPVGGALAGAGLAVDAGTQAQVSNISNQIGGLSNQIQNTQSFNQLNQGISNVGGAVAGLNTAAAAGFANLSQDINGVSRNILEQGYQNQLANCQQTNTILQQSQALGNTVQNGFTQLGFQLERNACDVKETSTANTQKIIDTLNNKWSTDSAATITQLQDRLATIEQTNALIAALGGTATTKTTTT